MIMYDKTLKVGDYVSGYNKGIHVITEIGPERPDYYNPTERLAPLVKLTQVLTVDLTKSPRRKSECDITYCAKVTKEELLKWADEAHKRSIDAINEVIC